jgi:methylmalonyl-CoA decarboxylase subunit alpha
VTTRETFDAAVTRALQGGAEKSQQKLAQQKKHPVRVRLQILLDEDSFVENGLLARHGDNDLVTDAVVTGSGTIGGRPVCVIANDPTIKAGAWGRQTIRKITRQQELAETAQCPLIYLVDSAGARLNEQFQIFIDRQHAGRIFWNQSRLSGQIPQICILFGPSPAGAAYIPAFCDLVIMVEGHASAFLGSPRMVKMATGEDVTAEDMGGARMHCTISGLGDYLAVDEHDALQAATQYLSYLPQNWRVTPSPREPSLPLEDIDLWDVIPSSQSRAYDIRKVIDGVFDAGSIVEVKRLFAPELICAFARIEGYPLGLVANQPSQKAGTLNSDSSDKGAHFVQLCDAYGLPLIFLCDTPGFMVGTDAEKAGIIRHGAKYLAAIAACSVSRICVVVRKAYGAGYFAMSGGGFQPDALLVFPHARMGIMGPEAAVNAVHFNRLEAIADQSEKTAETRRLRDEYMEDLDVYRAASEFFVDSVVAPNALRSELSRRLSLLRTKKRRDVERHHPVIRG